MGSYKWGYKGLGFLLRVSLRVLWGLGSRVDISGVISPVIWVIAIVILLITLLITTHEPPSRGGSIFLDQSRRTPQSDSKTLLYV